MNYKFKFKNQHTCDAAVIHCVDFRFHEILNQSIKEVFEINTYDLWTLPGCAKTILSSDETEYIEVFFNKIKAVSIGLHDIKQIILINHADCGGYGGRQAFQSPEAERLKHKEDLTEAKKILEQNFPELKVRIGYTDLNDELSEITTSEIK